METRIRQNETQGHSPPARSHEGARALARRWLQVDPETGKRRRDSTLELLKENCKIGTPKRHDKLDLRGIPLSGEDLSQLNLSGFNLEGADLSGANLCGTNLSWAAMKACNLFQARLEACEMLDADLTDACLNECKGQGAGFGTANLTGASVIDGDLRKATFTEACLKGADVRASNLQGASLRHCDLRNVDFTRAVLRDVDLKLSDVHRTDFHMADLMGARIMGLRNYTKANWVGTDISGIDLRGAYMIRRHIMDQNYLFEFRSRGRVQNILFWLWWLTSDCGRSLLRWGAFMMLVAFLFGVVYGFVAVDFGPRPTAFSQFYYSIVTLTTLGYGDVYPISTAAQIIASIETLLGYIGLGGLLSILSNKMARRAE